MSYQQNPTSLQEWRSGNVQRTSSGLGLEYEPLGSISRSAISTRFATQWERVYKSLEAWYDDLLTINRFKEKAILIEILRPVVRGRSGNR